MKIIGDEVRSAEIFLLRSWCPEKPWAAQWKTLPPSMEERPKVEGEDRNGLAITFVAEGDIHDIGHRLLQPCSGANGFDILDLG